MRERNPNEFFGLHHQHGFTAAQSHFLDSHLTTWEKGKTVTELYYAELKGRDYRCHGGQLCRPSEKIVFGRVKEIGALLGQLRFQNYRFHLAG